MKYINRIKLAAVEALCNAENKSTEYMIELIKLLNSWLKLYTNKIHIVLEWIKKFE